MIYSEKITILAGKDMVSIRKIETSAGDVYYRVFVRGYDNGKSQTNTSYDCNNIHIAQDIFKKLTGITIERKEDNA